MNKNETIADIRKEAEARFRELLEKHVDSLMHIQAMQQFNQTFDRIEAARSCEVQSLQGTIVKLNDAIAEKQKLNENSKSAQIELCNLAKLRKAASNALAELKLFRKIHDARLHFCDIVHVGNAKLYLHDALALFTDSPENENSGADNVTAGKQEMPGDATKLREALVNISRYADCAAMRPNDAQTQEYIEQIRKWANAALKKPARNCDVYDKEEVRMAYHLHGDGLMTMQAVVDWLYSANKERGDGSPRAKGEGV